MAVVEYSSMKPPITKRLQSNISDSPVLSVDQCIDKATEKLLFKNFDECIQVCEAGITEAHMKAENLSVTEKLEPLCILAVQAYAELNQWQRVMPFVQQVYGSVEDCPYKVMHLCILLHSKVKEYTQCHALSSVWLKHPGNVGREGYTDVVDVCIKHILLPQGKVKLIPRYLESCPGLTTTDQQHLMDYYSTLHTAKQDGNTSVQVKDQGHEIDVTESLANQNSTKEKDKIQTDHHLITFAKALVSRMKLYSLDVILKVAALTVCLYLIAFQGHNGDTSSSFSRLSVIGQNLIKALKSLLWPG
ncbi:peroxisome assembly protein 26-like [Mizuhopecten yessoensis]|uniref:Peroxisome assembly protein 26 n=1 Tax=Mizuhopecten yessoensis TaxID=6573 RepID=A0A210QR78_MIZYE|nr:peroxisome assembly protein 26-like [Mizuhopecten yessoensis]OWF51256.1 Peroxisome assembly protein 26 [Mizuhopecten yessoensis]